MSKTVSDQGSVPAGKSYYTPLPEIFAGILQRATNQQLQAEPETAKKLATLGSDSIGLELKGTGIELFFRAAEEQLNVTASPKSKVATWVRGTPVALFGLAKPDWARADSKVIIEGDATAVRDFEALLSGLDFDWEDKIASVLGDVAAHQLGIAATTLGGFAKKLSSFGRELGAGSIGDLLGKQAGDFTSRQQMSEFSAEVQSFEKALEEVEIVLNNKIGKS